MFPANLRFWKPLLASQLKQLQKKVFTSQNKLPEIEVSSQIGLKGQKRYRNTTVIGIISLKTTNMFFLQFFLIILDQTSSNATRLDTQTYIWICGGAERARLRDIREEMLEEREGRLPVGLNTGPGIFTQLAVYFVDIRKEVNHQAQIFYPKKSVICGKTKLATKQGNLNSTIKQNQIVLNTLKIHYKFTENTLNVLSHTIPITFTPNKNQIMTTN